MMMELLLSNLFKSGDYDDEECVANFALMCSERLHLLINFGILKN